MGAASRIVQAAIEVLAKKGGGALPTDEASRTFYRGTTPGDARRIDEPFSAASGMTFAARKPESAQMYGSSIEELISSPGARILDDESPEFWKLVGRRRPPNGYVGSARGGPVEVVNDAVTKAKAAGYDAVSFSSDSDIGTVILNEGAFTRRPHLPTDEAARMARAQEMGFDPQTYYHTTPMGELEGGKFNPNYSLEQDNKGLGATYFTKEKSFQDEASDFFLAQDPDLDYTELTTYPVKIKTENLFDYKNPNHIDDLSKKANLSAEEIAGVQSGDPYFLEYKKVHGALKEMGFRGYHVDEPGSVGLFYPDKGDVRSIFAKFDPAKSESGDILASVPAIATGLAGYGALSNVVEENNGQSSN